MHHEREYDKGDLRVKKLIWGKESMVNKGSPARHESPILCQCTVKSKYYNFGLI